MHECAQAAIADCTFLGRDPPPPLATVSAMPLHHPSHCPNLLPRPCTPDCAHPSGHRVCRIDICCCMPSQLPPTHPPLAALLPLNHCAPSWLPRSLSAAVHPSTGMCPSVPWPLQLPCPGSTSAHHRIFFYF